MESREKVGSALINLACHTHTLIRPLERSKLLPPASKNVLDNFLTRLEKSRDALLSTSETVRNTVWPLTVKDYWSINFTLRCGKAIAELQSAFLLLKPIHVLWLTLESRWTRLDKEAKRVVVLNGDEDSVIDLFKHSGRKMLLDVIHTYEARVNRVVSWVEENTPDPTSLHYSLKSYTAGTLTAEALAHDSPAGQYFIRTLPSTPSQTPGSQEHKIHWWTSQVLAEPLLCKLELNPGYPYWMRIPNLLKLRHRDLETNIVTDFDWREWSPKDLDGLVRSLFLLSVVKSSNPMEFSRTYQAGWTESDYITGGPLNLQDNMRVSIQNGRLKERCVNLYRNCLIISRWKGTDLIPVERIERSDLLQVSIHWSDVERHFGTLRIFWRRYRGEVITDAVLVPAGPVHPSTLTIWAAFLALMASRAISGPLHLMKNPILPHLSWSDCCYLKNIRGLQPLFGLLPLIKSKELDPYDVKSVVFHLINLGRSLPQPGMTASPTPQ